MTYFKIKSKLFSHKMSKVNFTVSTSFINGNVIPMIFRIKMKIPPPPTQKERYFRNLSSPTFAAYKR